MSKVSETGPCQEELVGDTGPDDNPGQDDGDANWFLPAAVSVELACDETNEEQTDPGGGPMRHRTFVKPGAHKITANNQPTNNGFACKECGKIYKHKISLKTHERSHSGMKPFLCQECGTSFARRDILVKHERTHTRAIMEAARKEVQLEEATLIETDQPRVFTCLECGKSYDKRSSLAAHEVIHTSARAYFS